MGIKTREQKYAKELDDVLLAVEEIVADVKAGKGISQVVTENLTNALNAMTGADQMGDEASENLGAVIDTATYRARRIAWVSIGKNPDTSAPAGQ